MSETMKWNDVHDEPRAEGSDVPFVRMRDGDVFEGVPLLDEDVIKRFSHWVGGRSVVCGGRGCDILKDGEHKARCTLLAHWWNTGEETIVVWEMPWGVARDVREEAEELQANLPIIRVKRVGDGLDTRYKVRGQADYNEDPPIPNEPRYDLHAIAKGEEAKPAEDDSPAGGGGGDAVEHQGHGSTGHDERHEDDPGFEP